jgi:hypothetical protein
VSKCRIEKRVMDLCIDPYSTSPQSSIAGAAIHPFLKLCKERKQDSLDRAATILASRWSLEGCFLDWEAELALLHLQAANLSMAQLHPHE